jgi:hypothetical protein
MADTTGRDDRTDDGTHRRCAIAATVAAIATLAMTSIALLGLSTTNADARPIVLAATVVGTAAGLAGAWLLTTGRIRIAGLLLVLSIVTPTFAAAVVNLVPFLLGIVLLIDSFRADGVFVDRADVDPDPRRAALRA